MAGLKKCLGPARKGLREPMTLQELNSRVRQSAEGITSVEIIAPEPAQCREGSVDQRSPPPLVVDGNGDRRASSEAILLLACTLDKRVAQVSRKPFALSFSDATSSAKKAYTADYYIRMDHSVATKFRAFGNYEELLISLIADSERPKLTEDEIVGLSAGECWASQVLSRSFTIVGDRLPEEEWGSTMALLSRHVVDTAEDAANLLHAICERQSSMEISVVIEMLTRLGYSVQEAELAILSCLANGWLATAQRKIPTFQDTLVWQNSDALVGA